MNIKNLLGGGSSSATSDRLKRANILRTTRDYEASLKLGPGTIAKQMQMKAFKKLKEAGGEVDNTGLVNRGAIHTGLASRGAVNKNLARPASGSLKSADNPFKAAKGLFK